MLVQANDLWVLNNRSHDLWLKHVFMDFKEALDADSAYPYDKKYIEKKFLDKRNFPHIMNWVRSQKNQYKDRMAKSNKPQTGAPASASEKESELMRLQAAVFGGSADADLGKVCFESGGAQPPDGGGGGSGGATTRRGSSATTGSRGLGATTGSGGARTSGGSGRGGGRGGAAADTPGGDSGGGGSGGSRGSGRGSSTAGGSSVRGGGSSIQKGPLCHHGEPCHRVLLTVRRAGWCSSL